jgi:beta-1,2-mannobiose phosphorylase / 1,2-beta-oligomannan phosphorylase
VNARFLRRGVVLRSNANVDERDGILNPACTRLRDGSLHLYPRMVAAGNVSRIGSFQAWELPNGLLEAEPHGYALEPEAPYELRDGTQGYGCEDPRVTFVSAIDASLMAYVAFGPGGPHVAAAMSGDGLTWRRLGLLQFADPGAGADKDAAFFPEPVRSPAGVESIAFYHRPTLQLSIAPSQDPIAILKELPPEDREAIALGYVSLEAVQKDARNLCTVAETHRLSLPAASWGTLKVGCGTPPVRVAEGWLSVMHGVDENTVAGSPARLRYCAGLLLHDPQRLDRILFRSPEPLFVPETPGEQSGTVANVVFPTGIDPRGDRTFDVFYGMADDEVGRGTLELLS